MKGLRERRNMSRTSRLCTHDVLINVLRLFWVVLVLWCEIGASYFSLLRCRWPDKILAHSNKQPTHVLLVADAQVRHPTIPPVKISWIGFFRRFIYELSLKKGWNLANRLNPHVIVFLGDMLASGRLVMTEEEYDQYYKRFTTTFIVKSSVQVYYIPGNNDVGLGISASFSKNARRRYHDHFGAFNEEATIENHTFALLDAPGLVEEDYQRAKRGHTYDRWTPLPHGPVEFIKSIAAGEHMRPLILFSHIPLFRPDSKPCGPLREKGTIRRGVGHGYQNTFDKQTTTFLLESLRPSTIFSADDRDYCEHIHALPPSDPESTSNNTQIREVTIKSFSPAKYIRKPGFQLLSLISPPSLPSQSNSLPPRTFADTPCFLPDQLAVYSIYLPCIALTLLFLFLSNYSRKRRLWLSTGSSHMTVSPHHNHSPYNPSQPSSPTPGSALWSPFSPFAPISPHSTTASAFSQPTLRMMPTTLSAPTFRASRPSTPRSGSPLLSPLFSPDHDNYEHDDEDSMFPTQYAARQESNDWLHDGEPRRHADNADEPESASFLPAPGAKTSDRHGWQWSWTFVLRGRRRRMTIRAPSWRDLSLTSFLSLMHRESCSRRGRRGVMWNVMTDFIGIFLPASLLWAVIIWWTF